jgi:hypothetical protein
VPIIQEVLKVAARELSGEWQYKPPLTSNEKYCWILTADKK